MPSPFGERRRNGKDTEKRTALEPCRHLYLSRWLVLKFARLQRNYYLAARLSSRAAAAQRAASECVLMKWICIRRQLFRHTLHFNKSKMCRNGWQSTNNYCPTINTLSVLFANVENAMYILEQQYLTREAKHWSLRVELNCLSYKVYNN